MQRAIPHILLWTALLSTGCGPRIPKGEAPPSDAYNLRFSLKRLTTSGERAAKVYFDAQDGKPALCLEITPGGIRLLEREGRAFKPRVQQDQELFSDSETHEFLLRRRRGRVSLWLGDRMLLNHYCWDRPVGRYAISLEGVSLVSKSCHSAGQTAFGDDFMRRPCRVQAPCLSGDWTVRKGVWEIPRRIDEGGTSWPYSLRYLHDRSDEHGGEGLCEAGYEVWDEYAFVASVFAESADTVVWLAAGRRGARQWKAKWSVKERTLDLIAVDGAGERVLDSSEVKMEPGCWYRMVVAVTDGEIEAAVDGRSVLRGSDELLMGGGIAVGADGGNAVFDDVSVNSLGHAVSAAGTRGSRAYVYEAFSDSGKPQPDIVPYFSTRPTMSAWAKPGGDWIQRGPGRWETYLPYFVSAQVKWANPEPDRLPHGLLRLSFVSAHPDRECRMAAELSFDSVFRRIDYCLTLDGKEEANGRVKPDSVRSVGLAMGAKSLSLDIEGKTVHTLPVPADMGAMHCVAEASWEGFAPRQLSVRSPNVFDDTFAHAPFGWQIGSGTWALAPRWGCDPHLSWFAGWNLEGDAFIWNKWKCDTNTVALEAFVAFKMFGPYPTGYRKPLNAQLVIGADARDPDKGYRFHYGYVDSPSRLYRNGQLVAESDAVFNPRVSHVGRGDLDLAQVRAERLHRRWVSLVLFEIGGNVVASVDGHPLLHYHDEHPLPSETSGANEGFVGVGVSDNGISVARIRISSSSSSDAARWEKE